MKPEEKLREMLRDYARAGEIGDAGLGGPHLRDEDFIRLLENASPSETPGSSAESNSLSVAINGSGELAPLRKHLAGCDSCLARFKNFYAFFAPAEKGEVIAGKNEIDAAWQSFAPRIAFQAKTSKEKKESPKFWAWLFPPERKSNYFAAFGWGFAALLLLLSGISVYIAWQANSEKSRLAGEIEKQKQTYEERLKTLEASAQNRDLVEQEKARLAEEKDEMQKQIARLQTEIDRAKQEKRPVENVTQPPPNQAPPDNSLVAINTPIYDVFPGDSAQRGAGSDSQNKLTVPGAAKNVVLILNAAGRAEFPAYQAEIVSSTGKVIWRGSGLRKDNLGNFTLSLSRAALKPGNYRLKLIGKPASGSPQTVAEYPISVSVK